MDLITENAIQIIKEAYLRPKFRHRNRLSKYDGTLEQKSYSICAAQELIKFLKQTEDIPPLEAIYIFNHRMIDYANKNSRNCRMFSIASDVAENVIDLLSTY